MWGECMTTTILSLACFTHFLNLNPYYSPGHSDGKRLRSAQVRSLKIIGYHVRLTRGRSPVRARPDTFFSASDFCIFFFVCEYLILFIFMDCFTENTKSHSIC